MIIHCLTKEDFYRAIEALIANGNKWESLEEEKIGWEKYRENTCIDNITWSGDENKILTINDIKCYKDFYQLHFIPIIEASNFLAIKIGDKVKCIKPKNPVHNFHDCDWFEEGLEFVVQYIGKNGNGEEYCGKEKDAGAGYNSIWSDWVIKIANAPEIVCVTTPLISPKPRFKVGNKVKIVKRTWKNSTGVENAVGKVGYIGKESEWWIIEKNNPFFPEDKWIGKIAYYVIGNEDGTNYLGKFIDEEIELVKEETCPEPVFKAGDKVRIKQDCSGCIAGKIYELTWGNSEGDLKRDLFASKGELKTGCGGCHCQYNWELVEESKLDTMKVLQFADEFAMSPSEAMESYMNKIINKFNVPNAEVGRYEHSFIPAFTTQKEKKSIMSIIKNIFKSDVNKAYEHFGFGSENDINQSGINEFIQYIFETGNTERAKFNEKLVEKYQEAIKK